MISHNDGTEEHGLGVGQDSAVLILNDTGNVSTFFPVDYCLTEKSFESVFEGLCVVGMNKALGKFTVG